ncbi:MAG: DNA-processing protein DprA [Candidatus Latescibacterota bacterium]
MKDWTAWLTLLMVPGIGPARYKALLERFGSPEEALGASLEALCQIPRMDSKTADAVRKYRDMPEIHRQLAAIDHHGVRVFALLDPGYPQLLREIPDPPPLLFVQGDFHPSDVRSVAIVGTRRASSYGKTMAEEIAGGLAQRGIPIVSGMARGIDSMAHRTALSRGGRTLAVLGCGVDVTYPPENRALKEDISNCGAVISEFPMGAAPEGPNFPRRNRIISGLSVGTIVIEAGEKSGALFTANYALEQNREVFAVPGTANAFNSRGANSLIKRGAHLVETVEDVLEELEGPLGGWTSSARAVPPAPLPSSMPPGEKAVMELLGVQPMHIDALSQAAHLPTSQLLTLLLSLELQGLVRQLPGKCFVRA